MKVIPRLLWTTVGTGDSEEALCFYARTRMFLRRHAGVQEWNARGFRPKLFFLSFAAGAKTSHTARSPLEQALTPRKQVVLYGETGALSFDIWFLRSGNFEACNIHTTRKQLKVFGI